MENAKSNTLRYIKRSRLFTGIVYTYSIYVACDKRGLVQAALPPPRGVVWVRHTRTDAVCEIGSS